jgi:hypothetical protein
MSQSAGKAAAAVGSRRAAAVSRRRQRVSGGSSSNSSWLAAGSRRRQQPPKRATALELDPVEAARATTTVRAAGARRVHAAFSACEVERGALGQHGAARAAARRGSPSLRPLDDAGGRRPARARRRRRSIGRFELALGWLYSRDARRWRATSAIAARAAAPRRRRPSTSPPCASSSPRRCCRAACSQHLAERRRAARRC